MTIQITILGLNQIGVSIGLALGKIKDQVTRIGNDREHSIARQAEKMGAIDKIVVNLPSAVRNADVVIMALPVDEIRETIEVIAPDLKPGCVLIDTSPVQGAVAAWAKELLPGEDRYFVSMTPSFNPLYLLEVGDGIEQAHEDLFAKSMMIITSPSGTDESALVLASNLTATLGATPLFSDITEADSLLAYSHILPELLTAALVNVTTEQPGWREARKLAGPTYAITTQAVAQMNETKEFGKTALLNTANVTRMLDQVINELQQLRQAIEEKDVELLHDRIEHARLARQEWLAQRHHADWEPRSNQGVSMPTGGEVIGRLFGIRPRKDKDKTQRK